MKMLLITTIIISGLAIASGTPEKEEGRKDRSKPSKQWIEKFDKNGDGKLDEAERKAAGEARKKIILKKFDKNGDGKLCEAERKAAAAAMKKRAEGKGKGKGKGKNRLKKSRS